jgi:hypothetical protein
MQEKEEEEEEEEEEGMRRRTRWRRRRRRRRRRKRRRRSRNRRKRKRRRRGGGGGGIQIKKRGFTMRVDNVASDSCLRLPEGGVAAAPAQQRRKFRRALRSQRFKPSPLVSNGALW